MSWDLFPAFATELCLSLPEQDYQTHRRWDGEGQDKRENSLGGLVPPASTTTFFSLLSHKSIVPSSPGSSSRLNQSDYSHPNTWLALLPQCPLVIILMTKFCWWLACLFYFLMLEFKPPVGQKPCLPCNKYANQLCGCKKSYRREGAISWSGQGEIQWEQTLSQHLEWSLLEKPCS